MDSETQDNDVYGLVRGLCESLFRQNYDVEEHPYLPQQDNEKHLRKLKSKAYEILLNKSNQDYGKDNEPCDPIVELLKHAYVLKVGKGRVTQANELEKYLDKFIDNKLKPDSVAYSTLQFLNSLKSFDSEDDSSLNIFYYGKPHPQLPEMLHEDGHVPPFQIYPIESFYLPKKFESILKQEHGSVVKYNPGKPGSKLALLGRFTSSTNSSIHRRSSENDSLMSNIPSRTTNLLNGMDLQLSSYFVPQIKDVNGSEDYPQICKEGIVTEPESPWYQRDPLEWFAENSSSIRHNQTEICETEDYNSEEQVENLDKIWEVMDKNTLISNHRTWETLGTSEPPKEPAFVSESIDATIHLVNIAQGNISPNQITFLQPVNEISIKEFINNVRLLLLGVESNTFVYTSRNNFEFKRNTTVHGISANTLENLFIEITTWGTCFKNLSDLIVPDPQTGKLQIEGLIFKALCKSIKEFLLFYHAAILRVPILDDGTVGLLSFLKKVRPLGHLIVKVAELCRCDRQRLTTLGEGIGILTHIYKEVTKVTEQNIALVFYSILKDCCEVYFRFLQHWIFEGVCADIYDEFMIKVRPQYLRTRGHRFWTRGFSINKKSVPGFLSELTDSILQCGKAVTLLKICHPQNPLCRVSALSQPPVRVCLSVGMLREQAKFYEEYTTEGEIEQGEVVTLHSAIQEQKETEKRRAELVIAAQQDTLLRLRKEREDALRKIAKEKNELLEQLKDQVEEVAQRKERDKDAELLADKLLLENMLKQEEEEKNMEKAERENTIKYYSELAEVARKRRIHADWRIRRMKLFDDRVLAISSMRREFINTPDKTEVPIMLNQKDEITKDINSKIPEPTVKVSSDDIKSNKVDSEEERNMNFEHLMASESNPDNIETPEEVLSDDENSNPTSVKINEIPSKNQNINPLEEQIQNISTTDQNNQNNNAEPTTTRAIRPTVLDITGVNTQKYSKEFDRLDGLKNTQKTNIEKTALNLLNLTEIDNMTEAQRNKLKVLQQEYGVTPNNNESTTILFAMENSQKLSELTETELNRLRNTQHFTHLNWKDTEIIDTLEKQSYPNEENKTELEMNRLRNTQHLTHLNFDNIESNISSENNHLTENQINDNKTEIQLNRLRNTQHLTHLNWNDHESAETSDKQAALTDAQINRNKVMSHFYNRMDELETHVHIKPESLCDWQRNRNRNMAHSTEQFDFELHKPSEREHFKDTPMSTTTDHFTVSTHSSSMQVQSCENTPFSEITNHSDVLFARSSDGMSSEDMLQSRNTKYFPEAPAFPNFIGLGSIPNTPSTESQQLTVADVEMIDTTSLQVYLERSVIIPLTVQSRLVNNAIIKYLLREHNMLSHLHSLRSYFFLLNGEFAKTLTQALFKRLYTVSTPVELFNSSSLSNFLEKALVSSLSSTYANSELLSLSVSDVPTYLQTSNPEILSCLSLNYKISWPLNIIFTDVVMQQYSRVFKFLLMVGRVLWVLQEDFHILKIERKATITKNYHKLQLYRHSMMQFMNALHTYLTCSVLHASWSEFEKELENATTLDEVCDTHVSYIKKILSRCMLNVRGEKMRACLCNIFKVVLKFHNRIRAQNWSGSQSAGPNYDNLEKMYVAFTEQRAYLVHVAEKLASSGYQPHLLHFLHALNINHRYDLTSKK